MIQQWWQQAGVHWTSFLLTYVNWERVLWNWQVWVVWFMAGRLGWWKWRTKSSWTELKWAWSDEMWKKCEEIAELENCWDWNQSSWWLRRADWDGLDVWNVKAMLIGSSVVWKWSYMELNTWWYILTQGMKSLACHKRSGGSWLTELHLDNSC